MFWIVLAAQLSAPLPKEALTVFSADDMPEYVRKGGINQFVFTRTTVRPDGSPQDCGLERSSGDPNLDGYTCSLILKRARFQAPRWIDGSPAYAVVRTPVTWSIGGSASDRELQRAYPADMDVSVDRLPPGAHSPTKVQLVLAVDDSGRVVGCDGASPHSRPLEDRSFPELVTIACAQMTGKFTALPARDAAGKPVRSVQNAYVAFRKGS
jgi:hypothetical protein